MSLTILHTGDLHFTDNNKNGLLGDIIMCTHHLLGIAKDVTPDVIVIAGDVYDEAVVYGGPASIAASEFILACAEIAPVLIIRGTTSHDAPGSVDLLEKLRGKFPIYATDKPVQVGLVANRFTTLIDGTRPKVVFSCFPTITKANVIAANIEKDPLSSTRETSALVLDMFQGWNSTNTLMREAGIPTIFVGHCTITGSETSTGQKMTGHDLDISTGDLKLSGCDAYLLGHIHKKQSWGTVFYCGSITRLNHGETEAKGFYVHDIHDGVVESRFYETPARTMRTMRANGLPTTDVVADVQQGELVRIVYEVAEEDLHKVDEEAIRKAALERGAADVKIEKVIIPQIRVRAEGISRMATQEEKLMRWAETTNTEITKEIAEKLALLETHEVEDVLRQAYAAMEENYATDSAAA
jgi:exonuclease SbcD